eukprot:SAG11_NODE_1541_length_4721_cov_6.831458_8_plen_61_part_00
MGMGAVSSQRAVVEYLDGLTVAGGAPPQIYAMTGRDTSYNHHCKIISGAMCNEALGELLS